MSLPLTHAGLSAPGISAALDLKFASTLSLTSSSGITPSFSRASSGTYFGSDGLLKYAVVNLAQYSEDYTNVYWLKTAATISANSAIAPDGKTTADKIQEDSSTGKHRIYLTMAGSIGVSYVYSVYAKAAERNWLAMNFADTTANIYAYFNLSDGTVGTVDPILTASIQSVGNGWYRCSIRKVQAAGGPNLDFGPTTGDGVFSYTGTTGSGIYAWGAQLETGSTPGTYVPTTNAANSAPRFDHTFNGTSWVSRGLLVEEQRTNGFLQSNGFGNSPWSIALSRGTVTQNAASPDGTSNAWGAECTVTAPGGFYLVQSGLSSPSATYTFSFFAKKDNNGFVAIEAGETSNDVYVFFDLTNGLSGNLSSVGGYTNISHGLSDCGNGWYRCRLTFTKSNSNNLTGYIYPTCNSFSSLGCTSGQSNFIFGAQYETGSFATSYIPTTSASTTRSADVCQIAGSDFTSFWNASEGSFAFDADGFSTSTNNQFILSASSGSSANSINLVRSNANDVTGVGSSVLNGGGLQEAMNAAAGTWPTGQTCKLAFAYKANDFAQSVNGAAVTTDTSGSIPTVSQMVIGNAGWTTGPLNGHIARLRYFNKRLTDKQLEDLCKPEEQLKLDLKFSENLSLTPVVGPTPSFSRASIGTYFGSDGILRTMGLNLLLYSEDFTNGTYWSGGSTTRSGNTAVAPDGSLTADTITFNSGSQIYQNPQISSSIGTISVYVKKVDHRYFSAQIETSSTAHRAVFDLDTALVTDTTSGTSASISDAGNGWFRCSVTKTVAGTTAIYATFQQSATATFSTGSGSKQFYMWGAQSEIGSSLNTYSKTTSASNSGPRFDHTYDGTSWISKGLLIEEQRTNIVTNSNNFSNWTQNTINASSSAGLSPDGTSNAWKIYPTSAGGSLQNSNVNLLNTALIFSLIDGSLTSTIIGTATSSAENVGNGWFRIRMTTQGYTFTVFSKPAGWNYICLQFSSTSAYIYPAQSGTSIGSPSGTDGILIYGAQIESGAFPTSYIPTTTTSVVRSADVCQITGTDFSGIWNQSEGSVAVEFDRLFNQTSGEKNAVWFAQNSASPSSITMGQELYNGNEYFLSQADVSFSATPPAAGITGKSAAGYKVNDYGFSLNGASALTDTVCTVPTTVDRLVLGNQGGYSVYLNGHISRLRYYAIRLPNRLLIAKSQ
jgi:hypothetical protein